MSKYCEKCGHEMNDEEKFCAACGAKQEKPVLNEMSYAKEEMNTSVEIPDSNQDIQKNNLEESVEKTLPKKEYSFCSSLFMCLKLIYNRGRIYTSVTMDSERLKIEMDPKRRNQYPVIDLSDVIGVDVSFVESNYWLYGAVYVAAAGLFADPLYCFIMALFCFWMGRNQKITIWMKNGREARIFSKSKRKANRFKEDLLNMIKR